MEEKLLYNSIMVQSIKLKKFEVKIKTKYENVVGRRNFQT